MNINGTIEFILLKNVSLCTVAMCIIGIVQHNTLPLRNNDSLTTVKAVIRLNS